MSKMKVVYSNDESRALHRKNIEYLSLSNKTVNQDFNCY